MRRKHAILLSVAVVLIAAIAGTIYAAMKVNDSLDKIGIDTSSAIISTENEQNFYEPNVRNPDEQNAEPVRRNDYYMLLIGLDTRDELYTLNTDTIIVAHIIPETGTVKLMSLPRDLRVETLDGNVSKINAIFADGYMHAVRESRANPSLLSGQNISIGGWKIPEEHISSGMVLLRENVEKLLDIHMDYSVLVHFDTLVTLVDAVGGIDIEVKRSMQYDDPTDGTHIHFEPGLYTMNGQQALNYARFRQDNRGPAYDSSDVERAARQQQIIAAIADKLASWRNVSRIFPILDIMAESFKTDMPKSEMIAFIRKHYNDFTGDSIVSVPLNGYWESPYIWVSDEEWAEAIAAFTSPDPPEPESPEVDSAEQS